MQNTGLAVGVRVKEIATSEVVYQDCVVQHSDGVGLVFEVHRTVSEGGTIETVITQVMVPWTHIKYVIVMEEST